MADDFDKNGHMNHKNHEENKKKDMGHMDMSHDHQGHDGHMNMDHGQMKMGHSHDDHGDMGNMDMGHNHQGHDNHMQMDHGQMKMDHQNHDMSNMGSMPGMDHDMSGMGDMGGMPMNHSNMKQRFWWSFALLIPLLFVAPFMGVDLPITLTFPGSNWVMLILAVAMYAVGTQPFFSSAKIELKQKKPAMMSLISMGLLVTFWVSVYAFIAKTFFKVDAMDYFLEFGTLVVIMLLGHLIEMQATMKAGNATSELSKLTPATAHVKEGDSFTDKPVSDLTNGAVVQVLAGESFPADGTVLSGSSQVDESLMTGESKPVKKAENSSVIGGTINGEGTLLVQVSAVGDDSFIGHLKKTLNQTEASSSKAESLANKVAGWLFWVGLTAAILALLIWTAISGLTTAFNIAVTTLIIACPHALGLAIPLVIQRTKALAAKDGILIKKHGAVLSAKHLDYALMDKTGTLTNGHFQVQKLVTNKISDHDALAIMAALEQQSSHPLAKAIVQKAKDDGVTVTAGQDVQTIAGAGISGTVNSQHYFLVSARYLTEQHIDFEPLDADGSISYLTDGHQVLAAVSLGDSIKDSAKDFVAQLKAHQITPVLVTGDAKKTANKVAQELGINVVQAEVSPEDKINLVKQYQQKGKTMMIGDGINDSPALAQADLSVAIGAGTDVAQASADAVLISQSLPKIIDLINLAHNANRKEVENLWWGAGYNILAIPTAAGLFAFAGIMLNPLIGAIVMSLSTVVVAINALLLHK
ncbi:Cation-transporting P-type ATPase (ZntA) [Fructobacillus cardui]|uniref:P-type Cu(+) transporter n=2 Tax=Fructobacillus cardui TaxID=2893170 RepID=A0ABN9YTS2_9LACO|nr:Cation-transporting P-type ATPase (ZntA) [Fructobacillus cardui]CAK1247043.1 Cation-transporting P-type ATPase (ZntA) [Fructobacillus cardui]